MTSHHNATVINLAVVGNQYLESSQYKLCSAPAKETKPQVVVISGLAYLHLFGRDVYDTLVSVVGELSRNFRDHQRALFGSLVMRT